MATAATRHPKVSAIKHQLGRLRRGLLQWILVEGSGRILIAALLIAGADLLMDRVFRMDFSQRAIMLGLMTAGVLAVAYRSLFRPLERKPNDDALLLHVERRHRQFEQSVISGWQFAHDQGWRQEGVSPDLVAATIAEGEHHAQASDFTDILDRPRFARNAAILAAGLIGWGLVAWGVSRTDLLRTWFDRNVLLGDSQWPQATYLEIEGVVNGELLVDRGANLELNVLVAERSRVRDVEVEVEFESDGKRTRQETRPTGRMDGRQRQLVLHNVAGEFQLRAVGGDAITEWVQVRLVEPLDLSELVLTAQLPEYVGGTRPLTGGGPHTLLAGSTVEVQATANLPIERMQLRYGPTTVPAAPAAPTTAPAIPPPADGEASVPPPPAGPQLAAGDLIPFRQVDPTHYAMVLGDSGQGAALCSGKYTIELLDATGRRNLRPLAFELMVVPDKPPQIAATLSGISGLVVPRALLPLSFKARDQFGLTQAAVAYQWRTNDEANELKSGELAAWQLSPADLQFAEADQEFNFAAESRLDLQPLGLPTGIVLRFHVTARDNQPGEHAGQGQSREFLLRVVTEEELRADLLRREVEQRALFQTNRDNQLQLMTELRALAAAVAAEPTADLVDRQRVLLEMRNRQKNIGTNLFQIAGRFDDFLAEATNNRLDESETELQQEIQNQTPSLVSFKVRYAERIIGPLRALDETEVYVATQGLDESRNLLETPAEFATTAQQTADLQELIVRKMDEILAAMEESQTYQEIVNRVIALKRLEQSLLDAIKNKQQSGDRPSIFDK